MPGPRQRPSHDCGSSRPPRCPAPHPAPPVAVRRQAIGASAPAPPVIRSGPDREPAGRAAIATRQRPRRPARPAADLYPAKSSPRRPARPAGKLAAPATATRPAAIARAARPRPAATTAAGCPATAAAAAATSPVLRSGSPAGRSGLRPGTATDLPAANQRPPPAAISAAQAGAVGGGRPPPTGSPRRHRRTTRIPVPARPPDPASESAPQPPARPVRAAADAATAGRTARRSTSAARARWAVRNRPDRRRAPRSASSCPWPDTAQASASTRLPVRASATAARQSSRQWPAGPGAIRKWPPDARCRFAGTVAIAGH